MGMVRISYEQMEQLRECRSEMGVPLSRLVAEAVNHWLTFIAPTKLDTLRATPPRPVSQEQWQSLNRIETGAGRHQRGMATAIQKG
jgi:hypothetical protein